MAGKISKQLIFFDSSIWQSIRSIPQFYLCRRIDVMAHGVKAYLDRFFLGFGSKRHGWMHDTPALFLDMDLIDRRYDHNQTYIPDACMASQKTLCCRSRTTKSSTEIPPGRQNAGRLNGSGLREPAASSSGHMYAQPDKKLLFMG